MTYTLTTIIAAFAFLQVKHFLCDYPLQTSYQLQNKGRYGHPGGILHSGIHVVGTLPVFLLLPVSLTLAAAVLVGEFLVHYHLDWGKAQVMKATGWRSEDSGFWWAIGFDQFAHHLTYIAIVWVLASASSAGVVAV